MWFYLCVSCLFLFRTITILDRYFRIDYQAIQCTSYDKIAVDQSLLVLHAYAQLKRGEPIDFRKKVREGIIFTHLPKPNHLIEGWLFYPFYGTTGLSRKNMHLLTSSSMLGFIGVNKALKTITIVFRNSRKISDWVSNLHLSFQKDDFFSYPGPLHKGYVNIFKRTITQIRHTLDTYVFPISNITEYTWIMTGHSLGGALATLMAIYLASREGANRYWKREQLALITFGSPYVAAEGQGSNFSTWMQERVRYMRCFERTTDSLTSIGSLAHRQWQRICRRTSTNIKAVPPTKASKLFHFEKPRFYLLTAHSIIYYRLAIYQALGISCPVIYKEIFS